MHARRLLVTGFRPGPAGVGRVMMNLINGFAGAGVEVHVLVGPGDHPELGLAADGVQVHPLDMAVRDAAHRVRAFLAELEPRVVLSNRDDANALMVAATTGLRQRPVVALRVGIHIPEKLRDKNPLARWRRRRGLLAVYRGADLLIGNSEGVCEGLRELLGGDAPPIHTLYNPLDLERARALAARSPDHPWFGQSEYRLLVSVGRLARMKDQQLMVRALALLPADCRLVIFGEGPQRRRLLELAARLEVDRRFDLPGHTDNPFAHVARADLFLLSSRFEGSPNALTEALAVGTPAVATDCPSGPREILADGRYGRLVPVGDYRALARAAGDTLEAPPAPGLLAEAVSRFDVKTTVDAYLRVLGLAASAGMA